MIRNPSLLITDDDRDFRETLREVFWRRGYRTLLAGDGQEAVRMVQNQEVHLVLIDHHMPRLTGMEAIERIKRLHAQLPCILISGRLDEELRRRAQADEVLSKPVNFVQVVQTVTTALERTYDWVEFRPSVTRRGDSS